MISSNVTDTRIKDPLHGITLEAMLTAMVAKFGWDDLGSVIKVRCFLNDPSIKSSLTFLRRTPWARKKLEDWYRREFVPRPIARHQDHKQPT